MGGTDDLIGVGIFVIVLAGGWYLVSSGALSAVPSLTPIPSGRTTVGGRQVRTSVGGGSFSPSPGGSGCGRTVYPSTGRTASGGAGKNQGIHYASSGQAATSHRVDITGWNARNYEATVYLRWPSSSCGKDHLTVKFWGPNHTDSTCCWCMLTLGGAGDVSFGGEGPHPTTSTSQASAGSVGDVHGKVVGLKGVIWSTGSGIHQEAWVDLGSGFRKVGQHDRATCGASKTETNPVSSQDVEFRFDCASVSYMCTTVTEIRPGGAVAGAGYASYAAMPIPKRRRTKTRQWMEDEE